MTKPIKYISSYFVDGLPSLGLGKNKGRKTAIGYFVGKQCVMSFPPRLNPNGIPPLVAMKSILRGDSIIAAVAAMTPRRITLSPEFVTVPYRVNLEKAPQPVCVAHHVPDTTPQRSNAEIFAAVIANMKAKRLAQTNAAVMMRTVETIRARRLDGAA